MSNAEAERANASQPANSSSEDDAPPKSAASSARKWLIRLVFLAAIPGTISLSYLWYAKQRIQELQTICEKARLEEDWQTLEREALSWFQWEPESAKPLMNAAAAAQEQGNMLNVSIYLSQLPDSDPESVNGLVTLSELEYSLFNRPLDAVKTWKRVLAIDPGHVEVHRRLSFFYAMTRQRQEMIRESLRAIDARSDVPTTYVYLFGADWMTFTNGDINGQWLQNAASDEERELFEVAQAYHYTRTMGFAEKDQTDEEGRSMLETQLVQLLAKYKSNIELLAYHLELATYRGDMENVLVLLENAPPESAEDSRFWRYKGWVHEQRDEYDEALAAYQKCLEMYPYDHQAHHQLAGVYRRLKEPEKVAHHQTLAVLGNEIRRVAITMPDLENIPDELFGMMAEFAELSEISDVAARLKERLELMQANSARPAIAPTTGVQ